MSEVHGGAFMDMQLISYAVDVDCKQNLFSHMLPPCRSFLPFFLSCPPTSPTFPPLHTLSIFDIEVQLIPVAMVRVQPQQSVYLVPGSLPFFLAVKAYGCRIQALLDVETRRDEL